MDVLIVEDELMARKALGSTLRHLYPDIRIAGETGSVSETVDWLENPDNRADLILMDVSLSDGKCFEIFNRTKKIEAQIIITTAYDSYALKAFEIESVDYLLKPVSPEDLRRAVERARQRLAEKKRIAAQPSLLSPENGRNQKERFLIRLNNTIVPVKVSDIAYFYAEDKSTYMVLSDKHKYVIDYSLDMVTNQLDEKRFYRISRNCIIAMTAVSHIVKIGRRYRISAIPESDFQMMVSRSKADDFINWMGGNI